MRVDLFDFELPESAIALRPISPRDAAKMLVVGPTLTDASVRDFTHYLKPGDVLVVNDTRVLPARLYGKRGDAKVEILLHRPTGQGRWRVFAKPAKRLKTGDTLTFAPDFTALVHDKLDSGEVVLDFGLSDAALMGKLQEHGHVPLPPYIEKQRKADVQDKVDYQTNYAHDKKTASVAAPTAGLHFTPELLARIQAMDVAIVPVTLHVGAGTFLPVKAETTEEHVMHSEFAEVNAEAANEINARKKAGGRVIAVGTTSLRTLESVTQNGEVHPYAAWTNIFITPGYQFKCVDVLLTNFHLPKSTLFMLVSAFSGLEQMKSAYQHAIKSGYRFYSYGDACLLYRVP